MSDGTNFYRLRVTAHRDRRYIKTNIRVKKNELTSDGRLKIAEKRRSLENLVRRTEEIVSTIDCYSLPSMNVDDVVKYIQNYSEGENFELDFFAFADEIIREKTGQSSKTYRSAINSFKSFLEKDSLDISEVTSSLMRAWEKWLRNKHGDGARAVSAYTACVAYIHGQARLRYNDEETGIVKIRDTFQYYKPPRQRQAAHRAFDVKIIQKMIKLRGELSGREKLGVDAFLISFALMGMNAPDLYSCTFDKKDILHYYRTKTKGRRDDKAEMFVRMEPCAKGLFREYIAEDGDVAFKFSSMYSSYSVFGENVNEGMEQKWLPVIVNAMRDRKMLRMKYQSFWRDEPKDYDTHPYCLKLFKQRWYMLAKTEGKNEPRIYALDERMLDVVQTDKALKVPAKFNAEAFFSNYFGIIVGSDAKPCTVKIKVLKDQAKYIETLRLHPSQTCVEQTPEYNVYQFHLVPTFDFQQEILSHGPDYEVLSPEWFRDEIKADIARMYKNYGL